MSDHENITAQPADQKAEARETKLLQALLNKGPALPVELAVRTYSFPEEIAAPLETLEREGYVERQKLQKGEMFVLTKKGAVRLLGK